MKRLFALTALCMLLWSPCAAAAQSLQDVAVSMAGDLDAQLVERLGLPEAPAKGTTMIVTTPVNINDLGSASPLARQVAEEVAGIFVRAGYRVQEIRKGKNILFGPGQGEMLLTRRVDLLDQGNVRSAVILTGTYTVTQRHVRFNLRLVHAPTNEVLAMTAATLPVNIEMYPLLAEQPAMGQQGGMRGGFNTGVQPSVVTRLTRPVQ
ncbi:MAG: FlgO family outer membrane protein [Desulfovibrionaceae bacterium]